MILGLDIGGTKIAVVRGDCSGKVHWRQQFATAPQRGVQPVFEELFAAIQRALVAMPDPVEAISVSIGGPLNILEGIILSPPNLPGWNEVTLKKLLQERFSLPVYIEHYGNAGALAEYYFGA